MKEYISIVVLCVMTLGFGFATYKTYYNDPNGDLSLFFGIGTALSGLALLNKVDYI